jgi:hypothetical protein
MPATNGPAPSPFVKVVCGSFNTAAVTARGALYAWGDNEHAQCGFVNPTVATDRPVLVKDSGVMEVSLGRHHIIVIDQARECLFAGRLPLAAASATAAEPVKVLASSMLRPLAKVLEANGVSTPFKKAVQHAGERLEIDPTPAPWACEGPRFVAACSGAHHVALLVELQRPTSAAVVAAAAELSRLASVQISAPTAPGNTASSDSGSPSAFAGPGATVGAMPDEAGGGIDAPSRPRGPQTAPRQRSHSTTEVSRTTAQSARPRHQDPTFDAL